MFALRVSVLAFLTATTLFPNCDGQGDVVSILADILQGELEAVGIEASTEDCLDVVVSFATFEEEQSRLRDEQTTDMPEDATPFIFAAFNAPDFCTQTQELVYQTEFDLVLAMQQSLPNGNFLPVETLGDVAINFMEVIGIKAFCDGIGDGVLDCSELDPDGKFQTINGVCNNRKNPLWGSTGVTFSRIIPPTYDDTETIGAPRSKCKSGKKLPDARIVSLAISKAQVHHDNDKSQLMMQFGQFIDHDFTHTPMAFVGDAVDCSPCDSQTKVDPNCFPLPMLPNDTMICPGDRTKPGPKYAVDCSPCDSQTKVDPNCFPLPMLPNDTMICPGDRTKPGPKYAVDCSPCDSQTKVDPNCFPLPMLPNDTMICPGDRTKPGPKYAVDCSPCDSQTKVDPNCFPLAMLPNDTMICPGDRTKPGPKYAVDCSPCDSQTKVDPNCFPLAMLPNDTMICPGDRTKPGPKCMPFIRSAVSSSSLQREQINQLTSYLDGSMVYGSDEITASSIRLNKDGLLKYQLAEDGAELLPPDDHFRPCRNSGKANGTNLCFKAGDERVNVQPGLTAMHTMFMREHNRCCRKLKKINPHWGDERLYQECRKIVGAEIQSVTYKEYLPRILNDEQMKRFNLKLLDGDNYFYGYDETCSVTPTNSYATAFYRASHSLIREMIFSMKPKDYDIVTESFKLGETFLKPESLYESGNPTGILLGMSFTAMERMDSVISTVLRDHLFESLTERCGGLDLYALNIQRGRDHGLPGYSDFREAMGLPAPQSFAELGQVMDPNIACEFEYIYDTVADMDVFPAFISENPVPGAMLGPLGCEVLGLQFEKFRKCDRFWFENGDQRNSFSRAQLKELRKIQLGGLMCLNHDSEEHAKSSFTKFSPFDLYGYWQLCDEFEEMDFEAWREDPPAK